MTMTNIEIKLEAMKKGVKLYEIPPQLGTNQTAFDKLMRVPLSEEMKEKILDAIQQIADSRTENR